METHLYHFAQGNQIKSDKKGVRNIFITNVNISTPKRLLGWTRDKAAAQAIEKKEKNKLTKDVKWKYR